MEDIITCWCGGQAWTVGSSGLRCITGNHFLETQPVALSEFVRMSNQFNERRAEEKQERREREKENG